jgi:hypothetical protein
VNSGVADASHSGAGYKGEQVNVQGKLRGQTLSISQFDAHLPDYPQPVKLVGNSYPLVPDGVPVKGHAVATFNVPQLTSLVDADLDWEENQGQLVVMARDNPDPLLDLPWQLRRSSCPSATVAGTGSLRDAAERAHWSEYR